MKGKSLLWKIPAVLLGTIMGLVMFLLIAVACILYIPPLRNFAIDTGISIASRQTGLDIDLEKVDVSVFHQSPLMLYRVLKGQTDLPVEVAVDGLFVGHRGQDTLICVQSLRLNANVCMTDSLYHQSNDISSIPIVVERLDVDAATFHSDSLIAAVGVDVVVGQLSVTSPGVKIGEGAFPLRGLLLSDADVGIDLRETPPDTTAIDTAESSDPMLMAFDAPDATLNNVRFRLTSVGLDISTRSIQTDVVADVSGNIYDARRIDIGGTNIAISGFSMLVDTLYGDGRVDLNSQLITSRGMHVLSDEMGAQADLSATRMSLETMVVNVNGNADFRGSKAQLRGSYSIDEEAYDMHADIEKVDLSAFMQDSHMAVAGQIDAKGKGVDPSRMMKSAIRLQMSECVYDEFDLSGMDLALNTDTTTTLNLLTEGLQTDMQMAGNAIRVMDHIEAFTGSNLQIDDIISMTDLTQLDTLRALIPDLQADIALSQGSPVQRFIEELGVDIQKIGLTLRSDTLQTDLTMEGFTGDGQGNANDMRLPAVHTALHITMKDGSTTSSLTADTKMTDGMMTLHDLRTDADLWFNIERIGNDLNGKGCLTMNELSWAEKDFGTREAMLSLARSDLHANGLRADVHMDDIPMALADSIIQLSDLNLRGVIQAHATLDDLPNQFDLSAEVLPLQVSAEYKPIDAQLSLGETPIVMLHNKVDLNGLPIYGADSTYLSLTGGMDLDQMRLDVTLHADSFAPMKLVKDGPIPVYGELAADIRGNVTGALDSIITDVEVTILPTTDLTYPIDKKNLAQVQPHGLVKVRYNVAQDSLMLGGQVNVDDGFIRYSPRIYPMMPFHVDSGSHVTFNGPIGQTRLAVSATQKVKGDVESEGEETRRVDFATGVRMNGEIDSIGISSIDFFLEAPNDEEITLELARYNEETREGLAAVLLATGMYVGKSNVAAQREGYALSSIINSRINAALANSKVGKIVDIDISSAQTEHAGGKTNDVNISISKSFFKDRFRITVGSTITDNPEVNKTSGLLSNLSAEYKLTKDGNVLLRAYADRDYNNVLEGELYKAGLGVRALKEWRRRELFREDSIMRSYALTTDAGVAYRSNNSIGPDLTIKSSFKNLMGNGETFTIKGNGAYYWALRGRHPGDPKKTDTYKFGVNTSLVFPYLHWIGDNNPDGDTRYMFGYQYENIAGGYGVHKLIGSFTYFIRSSKHITHAFTPFSLSVVMMKAESDSLMDKAAEYPQLIKVIAGDEFVPSIGYTFTYNDYRSKRAVNTLFEVGVKESGNLINALYCLAGHKWNEQDKKLGAITFNQFVKMNLELRNKFNFTDQVCIATRLYAGANIPLGNSSTAPLSEAFYAGGPHSFRAASPYAYGPGNFYSEKYNQNFFHSGDVKLEANFELRFPIVWKLYGAAFVDAGNVWNWYSGANIFSTAGITDYVKHLQLRDELYDGIMDNPELLRQIALGTGAGLRLDLDGLVIRLDIGVAIHAPYQTYKYDKKTWEPDKTQPINTYFNIPSAMDAIRINFGIGYPF